MVKYVGNMHGNEVHGREMILKLTTDLLEKYTSRVRDVQDLLNGTDIHLVPTMNPDGFSRYFITKFYFVHPIKTYYLSALCRAVPGQSCGGVSGRTNANGRDLNRDFPGWQDESLQTARFRSTVWLFRNRRTSF